MDWRTARNVAFMILLSSLFGVLCYCGGGTAIASMPPDPPLLYPGHLPNAAAPLVTPTFDGSGQAVHPGIVRFEQDWNGYLYWMVVTPYPQSDKTKEDPSILASHDGLTWEVPPGVSNPVALPATSFLADADLMYDPASRQLWIYYIEQAVAGQTRLLRKTSAEGVHWLPEQQILLLPDYQLVSPAVLKVGDHYQMWSVNSGAIGGCSKTSTVELRTSSDGVNWSAPTPAAVSPAAGYHVWHLEVLHVPSRAEYWMLQTVIADATHCADRTELMFATSKDGATWTTYSKAALAPGNGWDNSHIYRSTMLFDLQHDLLQVWYSGRNGTSGRWGIGYAEADYDSFVRWLTH